jgi:adenylate kinase
MHLLLLAPPGAGKGTQAKRLADHFGIEHIASGDLFRQEVAADTELGRLAQQYVDRGDLVPDEIVLAMLKDRLEGPARAGGYVLDGFPRTLAQAKALDALAADRGGNELDAAISLEVNKPELIRRMTERAHREGRSDDTRATIEHRLDVFDHDTNPLRAYYRDEGILIEVDGQQSMDDVTEQILTGLSSLARGR